MYLRTLTSTATEFVVPRHWMSPVKLPLLAGTAGAAACAYIGALPPYMPSDVFAVAGAISSIAATMLGFMLAALAILASISDTHLVSTMRRTGHYADLLNTLLAGCAIYLAVAASGVALLLGLGLSGRVWVGLVGLHCAALVSLLDIGRKLYRVLRNLNPR